MNKHKIDENKKKTLIPDIQRKEVGQFGMQIHSYKDDPTVMILQNKTAPQTTIKKKFLTELTPNYYGEDRNIPIRQYPEFQVEYESDMEDSSDMPDHHKLVGMSRCEICE